MIDYCTIIFDERERVLLPLHVNSLRHYMPDLFNIKVSICPDDFETAELCKQLKVEALLHPTYIQTSYPPGSPRAGFDNANRLNKLVESCSSDWVVCSHSDIVWTGDMMKSINPLMNDEAGMLGIWPHGTVVINRRAYNACHFYFWPISGFFGRMAGTAIRLVGLQERTGGDLKVVGVDVGMMLKMEMQIYNYKFDPVGPSPFYFHIGTGSYHSSVGHANSENSLKETNNKIQSALNRFGKFK